MGTTAPDFALPDTEGNTHTLSSYRGKPVVLEFMAPWCPHCQEDAPMFNALAGQYQNVQFLAVSATDKNKDRSGPITMDDMKWFKEQFKVAFPMLFDQQLKAANDYGVLFYPTVYILDENGTVASLPTGGYTWVNGNPESTRQTTLTQEELAAEIEKVAK
jgi:peroxiredoxin